MGQKMASASAGQLILLRGESHAARLLTSGFPEPVAITIDVEVPSLASSAFVLPGFNWEDEACVTGADSGNDDFFPGAGGGELRSP